MTARKRDLTGEPRRLLDYQGVAHYLSISVANAKALAKAGEFVKVNIGAAVRFDVTDLDAYVERKKRAA